MGLRESVREALGARQALNPEPKPADEDGWTLVNRDSHFQSKLFAV